MIGTPWLLWMYSCPDPYNLTSALRSAKKDFFSNLAKNIHSPKDFWSAYHKLSPNHQRIPPQITLKHHSAEKPIEKANLFNNFFASCFSKPSQPLPIPSPTTQAVSLLSIHCSVLEVEQQLLHYKQKTASGPDGISSIMLRNTASSIAPQLSTLFNLSLSQGKVPSAWKVSNVTPIHKAGDKSDVSNYRPISLLSLISKVLERIVHNQISLHLTSNKLLSNNQFGFRSGFSTQDALLTVTNDWHQLLSKNRQVGAVFFDIRKAFDSVPHNQIIKSLSKHGISGPLLTWLSDYLSNRSQRVVLEGASSTPCRVTSGVPQGSILGPLLFIIFMDSLNEIKLCPGTKLILYADDILLYRPVISDNDLTQLQQDINAVHNWTIQHGLLLNNKKTNVLPITRSMNAIPLTLSISNQQIPIVECFKYLGVTISKNLSWSQHITNTVRTSKQQLGLLHRKLKDASQQSKHTIYRSTVLPKLEYCAAVWDPHQSTLTKKLENTQSFACKIITKEWKSDYTSLLNKLQLKSLKDRRNIQKLKVCFKIINNKSCIPPSVFSPHPSPSPRHPHSQILFIPHVGTSSHKHSFFLDVIPKWNSLPPEVINSSSDSSFKSNLSSFLCNNYYN